MPNDLPTPENSLIESKNTDFLLKSSPSNFPKELSFKNKVILRLLALLIRAWSWTLCFSIHSNTPLEALKSHSKPFLILFWHNRLFLTIKFYRSFWNPRKTFGLTSASEDGAWVAELLKYLGVGAIRGSSSQRGKQAAQKIVETLNQVKGDVVITPDGPRGPVYSIKSALLNIAKTSNVDLLFVSAEYKNAWRLKSWDRFFLPKPFSQVILRGTHYSNFSVLEQKAAEQGISVENKIRQDLLRGCSSDNF